MKNKFYFLIFCIFFLFLENIFAKIYYTKDEILKKTFPKSKIERKALFLTNNDVKNIENIAKTKVNNKLFTYYVVMEDEVGDINKNKYLVFESCISKTKPVVFMVVVNHEGKIEQIEILAFYEPEEHMPSKKWFKLFIGKSLFDNLEVRKGIDTVSGATFTVETITREIRRILATFELVILKRLSK